jgi:M6 family metalloprotease-like protein
MRYHFPCRVALLLAALGTAVAQPAADPLATLTTRLRQLRQGLPTPEFTATARDRAARLSALIRTNPHRAIQSALPETEAAAMRTLAPGLIETSGAWEGSLEARVEDLPAQSRKHYLLNTGTAEIEVFPSEPPPTTRCAPRVRVQGVRLANDMAGAIQVINQASAPCTTTGQQKIAVILINFSGQNLPASVTPSFVSTGFFGTTRSVDTYWRETSYNLTSATGQVFGPYNTTVSSCSNLTSVRNAAISAADADVNFTQFTRVVIVHPNSGSCSIGVGTIGCGSLSSADGSFTASTAWLSADYLQSNSHIISVAVHELGHNLGLEHASTQDYGNVPLGAPGSAGTFTEYWDIFSAMGLSFNDGGTIIIGHYDAPQKAAVGWLASGSGYQTVTANGTFTLLPYESSTAGLKALKIQRPGTNKWLWVEYRQSLGSFDNTLGVYSSNIYSGALIHYDDPNDANYPQTLLLDFTPVAVPNDFSNAVLAGGRSWTDGFSTLKISAGAATSSGLTVTVTMTTLSPCDLNADGATNVLDVQLSVQKILGQSPCGNGDIDGNGSCNVVDLQHVVNAVLGGACTTP